MDQWGVDPHFLRTCIKCSVPMWLIELEPKGEDYWIKRKSVCAQVVAEKGDVILYGSKKIGQSANAFNHLAEGIALLILITKKPFEWFELRFNPDGSIEDLSNVQEEIPSDSLQSEIRSEMSRDTKETPDG